MKNPDIFLVVFDYSQIIFAEVIIKGYRTIEKKLPIILEYK